MSTLELADMLQQEITENPLLEEELERPASETQESEAEEAPAPETSVVETDGKPEPEPKSEDSMNEIDYESFFSDYLDEGYRPRTSYEIPELPPIENTLSTTASLADHLDWQLRMAPADEKTVEIGEAIIGNIDEHGYLQASVDEICAMGDYDRETVEKALALVQEFDPIGVGARDLRECLSCAISTLREHPSRTW
jgi:RNA polymerase sigma-54 factor